MIGMKIRIQALSDVREGEPLVEGMTPENSEESEDMTVAIQERGTVSGQTTLMFIIKDKNGRHIFKQITAKMFDGLSGALKGAEQRFKLEKGAREN